jgi:hypothetical protein
LTEHIDETRRNNHAFRIYRIAAHMGDCANCDDSSIMNTDVGVIPRRSRPIDDPTAIDNQVTIVKVFLLVNHLLNLDELMIE